MLRTLFLTVGLGSWMRWLRIDSESGVPEDHQHQETRCGVDACEDTPACLAAALEYAVEHSLELAESSLRNCIVCGPGAHDAAEAMVQNLRKLVQQSKNSQTYDVNNYVNVVSVISLLCIMLGPALRKMLTRSPRGKDLGTPQDSGDLVVFSDCEMSGAEGITTSETPPSPVDGPMAQSNGTGLHLLSESLALDVAMITKMEADLLEIGKRSKHADALKLELEGPGLASQQVESSEEGAELVQQASVQLRETQSHPTSASDERESALQSLSNEVKGLQLRLAVVSDEREVLRSELQVCQRQYAETKADNENLVVEVKRLRVEYADFAKDAQRKLVDAAKREKKDNRRGNSFWPL